MKDVQTEKQKEQTDYNNPLLSSRVYKRCLLRLYQLTAGSCDDVKLCETSLLIFEEKLLPNKPVVCKELK